MCRSIKVLREGATPATDEEIRAAALQFVRKISGFREPATHNKPSFDRAVDDVAASSRRLLDELVVRGASRRDSAAGTG